MRRHVPFQEDTDGFDACARRTSLALEPGLQSAGMLRVQVFCGYPSVVSQVLGVDCICHDGVPRTQHRGLDGPGQARPHNVRKRLDDMASDPVSRLPEQGRNNRIREGDICFARQPIMS